MVGFMATASNDDPRAAQEMLKTIHIVVLALCLMYPIS